MWMLGGQQDAAKKAWEESELSEGERPTRFLP